MDKIAQLDRPARGQKPENPVSTLDLAPIGNCAATALIDRRARFVWACCPRVDGEPVFSALLDPACGPPGEAGLWSVDIEDGDVEDQAYVRNTAILRTVFADRHGNRCEVLDFAPRLSNLNRIYRPWAFFRLIRPLSGAPRIRVRLQPTGKWGETCARSSSCTSPPTAAGSTARSRG